MVIFLNRYVTARFLIPAIEREFTQAVSAVSRKHYFSLFKGITDLADTADNVISGMNDIEFAMSSYAFDKA